MTPWLPRNVCSFVFPERCCSLNIAIVACRAAEVISSLIGQQLEAALLRLILRNWPSTLHLATFFCSSHFCLATLTWCLLQWTGE